MSHPLVDSTAVSDAQYATGLEHITDNLQAMAVSHTEDNNEPRKPVGAVFDIHELLVMILSPLSMKELSRALSVSKQFNKTILDSAELRRTLFLEPKQAREFLAMVLGVDRRCYNVPNEWHPVIVCEPSVLHEKRRPRKIIELHPILLRDYSSCSENSITCRNFNVVKNAPASAFLFQPPVNEVTVEHWSHSTQVEDHGGVTFGAILTAVENLRTAVQNRIAQSPRFATYQYALLDHLALSISVRGSVFNNTFQVGSARRALVKAKELAALDELEGKST